MSSRASDQTDAEPGASTSGTPKRRKRTFAGRLLVTGILGGALVLSLIAFADFVRDVNALAAPSPVAADGIVVVTGGQARIEVALQLLQDGVAQRLLISGVHDATSTANLVARTQADPSLFACCVDLDRAAMDTAGNARETASWAKAHEFSSLLVVTSAYHIPRTTREIARLLPDVDLIPFPIDPAADGQRAIADGSGPWPVGLLAREFMKLQLARVRHLVEAAG